MSNTVSSDNTNWPPTIYKGYFTEEEFVELIKKESNNLTKGHHKDVSATRGKLFIDRSHSCSEHHIVPVIWLFNIKNNMSLEDIRDYYNKYKIRQKLVK